MMIKLGEFGTSLPVRVSGLFWSGLHSCSPSLWSPGLRSSALKQIFLKHEFYCDPRHQSTVSVFSLSHVICPRVSSTHALSSQTPFFALLFQVIIVWWPFPWWPFSEQWRSGQAWLSSSELQPSRHTHTYTHSCSSWATTAFCWHARLQVSLSQSHACGAVRWTRFLKEP